MDNWAADLRHRLPTAERFRFYGARGEVMAPSSLQPNDGAPHATAKRFEQIPRRSRTGRDIDRGHRDGPVELAGRRDRTGSRSPAFEKNDDRSGCTTAASASLAEGSHPGWAHHQADRRRL